MDGDSPMIIGVAQCGGRREKLSPLQLEVAFVLERGRNNFAELLLIGSGVPKK